MLRRKSKSQLQSSLARSPRVYPHGTCVKTEEGYFLIRDGKRYRLPTQRILDSWAFPLIVETTEAAVVNYPIRAKLGFRDGSLIYNIADGRIYLVSKNRRRHITTPDALRDFGVEEKDVLRVSDYEINLQEVGEPIG